MSWNEVIFEDIITDSAFGPRFSGDCYDEAGNVATLRTTDLSLDGYISLDTMPSARIDENKFESHFLQEGDLVISRSGRIGTTALFNGYHKPVLPGAFLIRFRLDLSKASPLFFRFYFNSTEGQQRLLSVAQGAAQQNINITNVRKLRVPLPPLVAQHKITEFLYCYDNMIETNRRRISLLEESIHLLYDEWFVKLRFPNAKLYPIIDGVPLGWSREKVTDVIAFNPKTSYEKNVLYPFVPMQALSETSMVIQSMEERVISGGAKFQNEDTLFARITPCLENGKIGFVQFLDEEKNVASGSTEFIVMRSKTVSPYWVYCLARDEKFREYAISSMVGSDGRQRVNIKCFDTYLVLQPSYDVLGEFNAIVAPMFDKIQLLADMNQRLHEARNTFLPKLMSGDIQV